MRRIFEMRAMQEGDEEVYVKVVLFVPKERMSRIQNVLVKGKGTGSGGATVSWRGILAA